MIYLSLYYDRAALGEPIFNREAKALILRSITIETQCIYLNLVTLNKDIYY